MSERLWLCFLLLPSWFTYWGSRPHGRCMFTNVSASWCTGHRQTVQLRVLENQGVDTFFCILDLFEKLPRLRILFWKFEIWGMDD